MKDKKEAKTMTDSGMTLRDYFAAKALNGIFSNSEMWVKRGMDRKKCTRDKDSDTMEDYVAQRCYEMADAMLKERLTDNTKTEIL